MVTTTDTSVQKPITSPFIFPGEDNGSYTSLKMAPLITARLISKTVILVRVVAFIPFEGDMIVPPTLKYIGAELNRFNFCVSYDQTDSDASKGYEAMYLEYELTIEDATIIDVYVYVENHDPKTSRGTITTVQTS